MTATSVQVPESLLVCVREAQLFTPSVGWFELQSCPELEGPSLRHSAEGKFFLAVLHDSLSALCFGKDGLLGSLRSQCLREVGCERAAGDVSETAASEPSKVCSNWIDKTV